MFRRARFIGSVFIVSLTIPGCSTLPLPNFDGGALNPDIRFLRAGEVMNGVKCAMTEFLRERELRLLRDRWDKANKRYGTEAEKLEFLNIYAQEYPKLYRSFILEDYRSGHKNKFNKTGKSNPFSPFAIGVSEETVEGEKRCNFVADPSNVRGVSEKFYPIKLPQSRPGYRHWEAAKNKSCGSDDIHCTEGDHCVPNSLYCSEQLGIAIWDYKAKDAFGRGSSEGTIGNCAAIPDYSRFALDKTQQTTITLTLTGTNTGTAFYDTINATGLGGLQHFIATGGGGTVFPKADITGRGITNFEMAAQIPQTLFKAGPGATDLKDYLIQISAELSRLSNTLIRDISDAKAVAEALKQIQNIVSFFPKFWNQDDYDAKSYRDYYKNMRAFSANLDLAQRNRPALKGDIAKILAKLPSWLVAKAPRPTPPPSREEEDQGQAPFNRNFNRNAVPENPGSSLPGTRTRDVIAAAPGPRLGGAPGDANDDGRKDRLTKEEVDLVRKYDPTKQYQSGCGIDGTLPLDDKTDVDYNALKDMLLKVVFEQDEQLRYQGGPEISLDQLTLTTSFQLILDTSAGTKHIFRIFPMIAAPQMGARADHLHQLKIVLKGQKRKGDVNEVARVEQSCLELVTNKKALMEGTGAPTDPAEFCRSPVGKLLTKISDSLENSKSSSGAPAAAQ